MESSIAKFLWRQPACERLPTINSNNKNGNKKTGLRCQQKTDAAHQIKRPKWSPSSRTTLCKLTWLVLGGDPAARSHRVEQFTAL